MDEKKSKIWTFSYKVCKKGHTARISHENGTFQCHCISNIFMDCYADLNGNKVGKIISKTLCLAQIITALVGIVLNMVICYVFCKNVAIRKKNSNNLLFNQAFVDLVNCIFYALPNSSFQLVQNFIHREADYMFVISKVNVILSASSSSYLFAVMQWRGFCRSKGLFGIECMLQKIVSGSL